MPATDLRTAATALSDSWGLAVGMGDIEEQAWLIGALGAGMELARRQLVLADLDLQDACSSRL